MKDVVVYTKPMCPFCVRALMLLQKKGVKATEISAAYDKEKREEMLAKSNGKTTYPQIFIGETHVGGYDDLAALERDGKLDPMLNG
ncbi:glutaredoxin 3 [Hyphococcus luteus]|uniref:Glutaredoxin n=1 Tax=Hyphococcus luteus TaxID=2058213 RepID=A0A2S7K234_9PROT|nr:glutaredoxin 3 [Marinicaulis flavus]PQA86498.1 glutaredoxin 3 [Marinicaulis flavus]